MRLIEAVERVRSGGHLSRSESRAVFATTLREDLDAVALAELLRGLAERGEQVDEIAGAAEALRDAMTPFVHDTATAVDTCGTGGDGLGSFNLSTAAAVVAAAAGARVIKHGNRSVSSKCGSADLLEAAGVRLELTPEQAAEVFRRVGIVYLHAPAFHPAMRFVAPVRKQLGIRTIFNFLGPLCNPGSVRRHLLGVSDAARVESFAGVLRELDFDRAFVVHGAGGADELTLAGENQIAYVGAVPEVQLDAGSLGLPEAPVTALQGGEAPRNLAIFRALLDGEGGAIRDAVCLNACAALIAAGVHEVPAGALAGAREALDSGAARDLMGRLTTTSHLVAGGLQ